MSDIERHVKRRTLVQLGSIEGMIRNDAASKETVADYIRDCREELDRKVNTEAEQEMSELYRGYSTGELRYYDNLIRDILQSDLEHEQIGDTFTVPAPNKYEYRPLKYDLSILDSESDMKDIQSARGGPNVW